LICRYECCFQMLEALMPVILTFKLSQDTLKSQKWEEKGGGRRGEKWEEGRWEERGEVGGGERGEVGGGRRGEKWEEGGEGRRRRGEK
jgi:hypothetical protein